MGRDRTLDLVVRLWWVLFCFVFSVDCLLAGFALVRLWVCWFALWMERWRTTMMVLVLCFVLCFVCFKNGDRFGDSLFCLGP
ncbi:hypothetical protein FPQ18DRAFT_353117 [Pyronema domesticum]|nr:hypothetical protein FPQ18DRAFT_353117 [Pyronema domesticum]